MQSDLDRTIGVRYCTKCGTDHLKYQMERIKDGSSAVEDVLNPNSLGNHITRPETVISFIISIVSLIVGIMIFTTSFTGLIFIVIGGVYLIYYLFRLIFRGKL